MTEEFDPKVYLQQGAWRDVRLGLHRTEELLERPQDRLRIVHVAGTNGKGSTCAFTAGILQAAGYKVGLFTSPYVLRFNERIQVNREDISDEDLLAVALEVREAAEQMDEQPTAFELITAAALLHFAQVGCTAVVLEVGLGGRLDSTNVVVPEVCAITSIALDHTHVLGDTIAKIAHEKAGIIKAGIPVVSYKQKPEAEAVIIQRAREVGAPVSVPRFGRIHAHAEGLHQVFSYDGFTDVRLKIRGKQFFKVVIYLPNLIMASAFAMLFFALFSDNGPVNAVLLSMGWIKTPISFLNTVWGNRGLIGLMNFLMWFGNTTIMLMAAIMGVDPTLYEAAELDGCTPNQMFWKITIPLIRPILVYVMITSMIGGLQMFDVPQILTNGKGGPDRTSTTMIMYLNNHLFSKNYGMAGAVSVVLFLVCAVLCVVVYFSLTREDDGLTKAQRRELKAARKAAAKGGK